MQGSIKDNPYILTLGFHDYFWFLLRREEEIIRIERRQAIPELSISGSWWTVFQGKMRERLERGILPPYMEGCRWFGGKARKIQQVNILENITVGEGPSATRLLFLGVRYIEGLSEIYLVPLSFTSGDRAEKIISGNPNAVVARLRGEGVEGIIYDGVYSDEFQRNLFRMIPRRQAIKGVHGKLAAYPGKLLKNIVKEPALEKSQVLKAEQSNTSILFGNEFFLKFFRRLDEGINPELDIGRFLTETASFPNVPPFAGAIEYRRPGNETIVIGIVHGFVPNQGVGWEITLDSAGRYFERVLSKRKEIQELPEAPPSLLETAFQEMPPPLQELIGGVYLEMAALLGKRTAGLHLALSTGAEDPNFAPEPFSVLYQKSIYQSMESLTKKVLELLWENLNTMPGNIKEEAEEVLSLRGEIMGRFGALLKKKISAMKIRIHGDYHLGQVLYTGNDFVIIDFEGEPARALSERRLKRSPLRDVAGMIRSFHYASYASLFKHVPLELQKELEPWSDLWYRYAGGVFLKTYLDAVKDAPFIPKDKDELDVMLRAYVLEKAVYELGYELNNRPDWVIIPIKGIKHLLKV